MAVITILSRIDCTPAVQEFIDSVMDGAEIDALRQAHIATSVEEIFVNIANYSYSPGEGTVTIIAEAKQDRFVVQFHDSGKPFNPLDMEDPDVSLPADKRQPGGLGIFMVKQMMDGVEYRRAEGKNILTLVKLTGDAMMEKGGMPLLQVQDISLNFKIEKTEINVLENVSFNIQEGQIVGLVGESGCGKSVTSLAIMRLLPQNAMVPLGQIILNGEDLLKKTNKEMVSYRGKTVAMIFQEPMTSLNPVYSIESQLTEMFALHTDMTKKEAFRAALKSLEDVAIPSPEKVMKQYPHELSGGMRQRVMIAMAMSLNPKVLIADEPTTALDVTTQAQILQLLCDLRDRHKTSILLITHDLGVVAEVCDHVIVMYAGHIVEEGSVFDIFENPSHPYTLGLLKSLPELNEKESRLYNIKGSVPSPSDFSKGCRFAPRCNHAVSECEAEVPSFAEIGAGHKARCRRLGANADGR